MRLIVLLLLIATPSLAADRTAQLRTGALAFTASVETIRLADPKGAPVAEIVATSFTAEGADRPVTFLLNGGPGAGSGWLDVGAAGPYRVKLTTPSQDPALLDNDDTWLRFTDLVFIDPVGTGYSRALGDDAAERRFLAVDPDIESIATAIRRWLEAHQRLASPKFVAGESYGGFRAPRLARALLEDQGIGVRGLVLISPVLDFNGRDAPYDPLRWAARLTATVAATRGATDRGQLAEAEAYARDEYLADLLRGPNDAAAQDRIAGRVAALTGLDAAMVRRREGRLDIEVVLRDRNPGRIGSYYDATLTAADPFPGGMRIFAPDALLDGLRGPVTAGMLELYRRIGWQPEGAPARQYQLLSNRIAAAWDYGRGNVRPESMTALRQYLALDPQARVLVVHGLSDMVTPYFADVLLLDQVAEAVPPGRLSLVAHPGGHMMYTRDASRAALAADVEGLIRAALAPTAAGSPPPPSPPAPAPGTPTPPPIPR